MMTEEKVLMCLAVAAFYADEDGVMYRIEYHSPEDRNFTIFNEDSGEEYVIGLDEVGDGCKFYRLEEVICN